ncbi:hypothetical protein HPB51_016138 [Rhipicephalus microplus]|uniref:HSF-type DNA-binding domain-containing protein n=1 Tax=Rhipicephalus microplus TaxID=6941 RepID=A0A9J6DB21_RHIMP|nr:hypothetical protein HPB51_016138 [Rhipicephalus microplus]
MPPKDVPKKKRGSSLKKGRGKKAPDSSASKDSPLLPLRFPEKLWMIVNDCKSGAISWSVDGSAIAIDYMKFQVGYLKNRPDIFKTKNISSFLRQLNMYGFKKISPPCSLDSEKTGLHFFRNRSFAKGRPDLLPEVNRKSVELWSKAKKRHESLYKAAFQNCNCGIMQYQGCPQCRNKVPRHEYREETVSPEKSSLAHSSLSAELPESCTDNTCHCSDIRREDAFLNSPDSTSDLTTSDNNCTANDAYKKGSDGDNRRCVLPPPPPAAPATVSAPPRPASTALAWLLEYSAVAPKPPPQRRRRRRVSPVIQPEDTMTPTCDINALLDPNESPMVVLRHMGRDEELVRTPPIEDLFLLNDHVRDAETTDIGSLGCIFATEDVSIDVVEPAAAAYIPSPDLFASATPKIICSHGKEKAEMSSLFVHEEDERVPLTSCVVYPPDPA